MCSLLFPPSPSLPGAYGSCLFISATQVLGVANKRLYELRLQTSTASYERDEVRGWATGWITSGRAQPAVGVAGIGAECGWPWALWGAGWQRSRAHGGRGDQG